MKTVEAVKSEKQINDIETLLRTGHGNIYSDIWGFGINTALRISDLINIKFSDIDNGSVNIIEQKTKKSRVVNINKKAWAVINRRRSNNDKYLFEVNSNRAKGKPISRQSVARAFKDVGERLNIKLGTHSMRKTRGFFMYNNGVNIALIAKMLNHSSTSVTLRYIGIEAEDVAKSYTDFEL